MAKFTVLTATYDNGPTLEYAIESLRAQSFGDWEHVIVGDGAVDSAREIAQRYVAEERRASFIDSPKGEGRGELLRHAALQQAGGELICYLSDDDLWLTDHLIEMLRLIEGVDFAHSATVAAYSDGSYYPHIVDLELPYYRERMLSGDNWVSPTTVVHTRAAYERIEGWKIAGPGEYSDLTLWRQFLSEPDLRLRSSGSVTAINLPKHDPTRKPGEQARLAQLQSWCRTIADPQAVLRLRREIAEEIYRRAAHHQADAMYLRADEAAPGPR